jgi:hypothetical protein
MQDFFQDLVCIAQPVGRGDYEFRCADGRSRGYIQLIPWGERRIQIHRLWAQEPGKGDGSVMLRALCDAADRHGVEIQLKVTPFGSKPYPLNREQLHAWYQRHGFEGTRRKMVRKPRDGVRETT